MRTRSRLFSTALAITTLALPVAVADVAVAATRANSAENTGRPSAIDWSPCPENEAVQCGTVRVPIDWSRPHGAKFDLALARRPASDPAARIGSLQVNPGGPGGSGRLYAIYAEDSFSPELLRRFDIVGIDSRGVGLSNPIRCSQSLLDQAPPYLMNSQAEFDARLAYNARLRADCRARSGPLFDHVDMLSVVRDMDHVRELLGDAKMNFFGVSYGSMNAQQYAEMYPDRVGAIVSDSNLDHSLDTRGFLDTEAASAQDAFNEFVKWNDRTASSPLHGRDVRAFWHDLLDRAARGEIPHPWDPSLPGRPEDLISAAFGLFYGPDWSWLAELLVDLDAGFPAPASAGTPAASPAEAARADEVIDFASLAIFCNDWSLPIRNYQEYVAHLRRLGRIAPDMRFAPPATGLTVNCLGSPARIANPQHRLRVKDSATPLLLLNALHDPATGYNRALGVARQLGREGVLLTYDGWGHGVYRRSACTIEAVDRYLIERRLPRQGSRCPAVEPPVWEPMSPSSPQARRSPASLWPSITGHPFPYRPAG